MRVSANDANGIENFIPRRIHPDTCEKHVHALIGMCVVQSNLWLMLQSVRRSSETIARGIGGISFATSLNARKILAIFEMTRRAIRVRAVHGSNSPKSNVAPMECVITCENLN